MVRLTRPKANFFYLNTRSPYFSPPVTYGKTTNLPLEYIREELWLAASCTSSSCPFPISSCTGWGAADYCLPQLGTQQVVISSQGAVYSYYTMPGFVSCTEAMNLQMGFLWGFMCHLVFFVEAYAAVIPEGHDAHLPQTQHTNFLPILKNREKKAQQMMRKECI